jgi:hypothetical protein
MLPVPGAVFVLFGTGEIASRARKAGMALGYDFREKDYTLPLPATLVKALGESVAKERGRRG